MLEALLAAYAARAASTLMCHARRHPTINKKECYLAGAKTFLVNGLITDAAAWSLKAEDQRLVRCFTLKEPYRIEGQKNHGLELAEQFDWELTRCHSVFRPAGHWFDWNVEGVCRTGRAGWLKSSKKRKCLPVKATVRADLRCFRHRRTLRTKKVENAATIARAFASRPPSATL